MRLLAYDPGSSGSAAMFDDLELTRVMSFAHTAQYWKQLYWWLLVYGAGLCVKERVGGWAGQGGKSMFTFGWHDCPGQIIPDICDVPVELVEATWWQRRLGLPHHYEAKTRDQGRRLAKKDQMAFCIERWPFLKEFDKVLDTVDGGRERPDIWQSVCIGYAKALDIAQVPMGRLK